MTTTPSPLIRRRGEGWVILAILITRTLLAMGFSAAPIFEGTDELGHYRYIRYLHQVGGLPDVFHEPGGEFQQAPLYYLLLAPFSALLPDSNVSAYASRENPYLGYAARETGSDNKNIIVHPPDERFPYSENEAALAVHLLRLFSALIGSLAVKVFEQCYRLLWPDRPARRLIALGIAAFWPLYVYISGVITNDSLTVLLAATTFWISLRLARYGFSWPRALGLGLAAGLALMTRLNNLFVLAPAGLALLLDRRAWRSIPAFGALALSIGGWWYARNWVVYHDPFLNRVLGELYPHWLADQQAVTPVLVLSRLYFMYYTMWANFGFTVITVHPALLWGFGLLSGLTLLTLPLIGIRAMRGWAAGAERPRYALLSSAPATRMNLVALAYGAGLIAMVGWGLVQPYSYAQGRYLVTGIPVFAALMALTVEIWTPARLQGWLGLITPPLMGAIAAACLFGYWLPAFELAPVPVEMAGRQAIRFGDTIELLEISTDHLRGHPGDAIPIRLVWRALRPADQQLVVIIEAEHGGIERRESLPGAGKLYATEWQSGQMWSDRYVLIIPPEAAPGEDVIRIRLVEIKTGRAMTVEAGAQNGIVLTITP
jgi:hypothetical protein